MGIVCILSTCCSRLRGPNKQTPYKAVTDVSALELLCARGNACPSPFQPEKRNEKKTETEHCTFVCGLCDKLYAKNKHKTEIYRQKSSEETSQIRDIALHCRQSPAVSTMRNSKQVLPLAQEEPFNLVCTLNAHYICK